MFKKVKRYLKSPYYALGDDLMKAYPKIMSDKYYIKVLWKQIMGYPLDLRHPKTFNEKLQWMKLYDRNPLYTDLVDKYKVKQWVADKIGSEHVIPTLAVYDSVDEIDISQLPDQFVLKCNHDSGGVVICKDKSSFDFEAAKAKLRKSFEHNFYWDYREWPYLNVEKKIFAEYYLEDTNFTTGLPDYKFFSFNGNVVALFVALERNNPEEEVKFDFYDMDFHRMEVNNVHPNAKIPLLSKPECFDEMKDLARVLSEGLKEVRVDFYETGGACYFGEMTLFHGAGFMPFAPKEFDVALGQHIIL